MKFLKHANEDHWWKWDTEKMKVYISWWLARY